MTSPCQISGGWLLYVFNYSHPIESQMYSSCIFQYEVLNVA